MHNSMGIVIGNMTYVRLTTDLLVTWLFQTCLDVCFEVAWSRCQV